MLGQHTSCALVQVWLSMHTQPGGQAVSAAVMPASGTHSAEQMHLGASDAASAPGMSSATITFNSNPVTCSSL